MSHSASADAVVLALLRRSCDERRLLEAGTYHLPIARSILLDGVHQMAWYVPGWHHETPCAVRYWGIIEDRWLTTRRLYLPDEHHHPHADDLYWVVRISNLERLDPVLQSARWRRVGVHRLSVAAFQRAADLGEVGALRRRIPDAPHVWEW
ncbi:MAG: hypothetical protein RLY87_1373 [Chloroflexota bacterium]